MGDKRKTLILLAMKQMKAYFINFLAEVATFPIYIIIIYLLWKTLIENSSMPVNLMEIVTYYVINFVVLSIITETRVAKRLSDDIRTGEIVKYLARPLNYIYATFWSRTGAFLFFSFLYLPTLFLFSLFFKLEITNNFIILILFVFSLVLAMIMNFLIMLTLGITSFWTTENMGAMRMFNSIKRFLAGSLIPLSLIPGTFGKYILMLPFKYTLYFPISILQGKVEAMEILKNFVYIIIWIILFWLFAKWFWKKGEKHLAGVGV